MGRFIAEQFILEHTKILEINFKHQESAKPTKSHTRKHFIVKFHIHLRAGKIAYDRTETDIKRMTQSIDE